MKCANNCCIVDVGEPLTAEEQEEKEKLLEEVSGLLTHDGVIFSFYMYQNLAFCTCRDFQHGVGETSMLLSGHVRSMVGMT